MPKISSITYDDLMENNEPSKVPHRTEPDRECEEEEDLKTTSDNDESIVQLLPKVDISKSTTITTTENDEIPWKQLSVVFSIFIIDVFSFTTLAPYLAALVKDMNLVPGNDSRKVGYYASLIGSSYYIAQFFSAFFWGTMSDKYGRRIVLLIGILGGCITSFLFGFSKNLHWAITTRVLFGLVNGNLGTHKVYISEITHKKHHARVFSYISLSFSIGSVFGPIVGGFLSSPVEQYPRLFAMMPAIVTYTLKMYPFLLPNMLVSTIQLFAFVMGYKYLQESNPRVLATTTTTKTTTTMIEMNDQKSTCEQPIVSAKPSTTIAGFFKRHNEILTSASPFISIVLYALIGFNNIVFAECAPLFMILDPAHGGLGFKQRQIGLIGSITGLLMCMFQIFACHKIMTKLGLLQAFRLFSVLLIPLLPLYPLISKLANHNMTLSWMLLIVLNFVRFASIQTNFASCNVMMNNSVLPQNRGKLNGLAQSVVSLARAFAPLLGIVFAFSVSFAVFPLNIYSIFLIMSAVHALSALLTIPLTSTINEPKTGQSIRCSGP